MVVVVVSKSLEFDAAHFLPGYSGKCSQMHGHRWKVEVACSGPIGTDGFVIDFTLLKSFLKVTEDRFDHKLINDIISNPTAENIALDISKSFSKWVLSNNLEFDYVKVWETADSCATIYA